MANNTVRNPWIIDTAHLTDIIGPYPNNPVFVRGFTFHGYTGATDRCRIEDDRGDIAILNGNATFEDQTIMFDSPTPFFGLLVTELGSGKLSVFIA